MHKARNLALELGLSMKISDVDYQGDKTKATFYYTAEGRVDFRELIKRMAESFRIRIEMRQIGMRQEASRLGGIGSCGRELCCSTWLTDFKTVSTSAARYQNLSLNTLKLAGQCGKLKCCLNYELDSYMDALKDIPNNVDRIETLKGNAYLQKTDIFKKMMWFSYPGAESWIALPVDQVKELIEKNKQGIKVEELITTVDTEIKEEKIVNYDYENVVGQDSLTRLDEKNKRKRNNKGRSKPNNRAKTVAEPNVKTQPVKLEKPQQKQDKNTKVLNVDKTIASAQSKEGTGSKPKRRFNKNRNNRNKGNNTDPSAE
ncbi:hypothetical protein L950_0229715 [Sphingobacterium sp. IITKGP-BTPF85]|nr:hypothetical protein L950_0229715 [Sphingobacterium sp. IITKGP-BTPF85]